MFGGRYSRGLRLEGGYLRWVGGMIIVGGRGGGAHSRRCAVEEILLLGGGFQSYRDGYISFLIFGGAYFSFFCVV